MDWQGRVIGINSQIISRSGSSAGVGFAVPINTALRVVPELIAKGEFEYAYLGISGASLTHRLAEANGLPEGTRGALVLEVVENGPAHQAGLLRSAETAEVDGIPYPKGGDVITAIDGMKVEGLDELIAYMAENSRPGDEVTLEVLRAGERASVDVRLSSRPEPVA